MRLPARSLRAGLLPKRKDMPYFRYAFIVVFLISTMKAGAAGAETQTAAGAPKPKPAKKMKMNESMPTGMARQGMMKGEVKKAAEKKDKEMKPMMDQEEKAMPQSTAKH